MAKKYENLENVPLFGEYTDPFVDRRVTGPSRPGKTLPFLEPDYRRRFDEEKLYYSWMGHSSAFLHMHGLNILIDPVFSKYTSPVQIAGPRRFKGRVVKAEELPEIDLVLVTHSHYDHLDKNTIKRLDKQIKRYIVPSDTGKILVKFGVDATKITELGWYDEFKLDGLRVVLVPSQHDTARSFYDMNTSLWGGYILKDGKFTVYDSGDGGFGNHFHEIHDRYGDVDLAIMECGQYNVKWHAIHMFPEECVEACRIMKAKLAVPVHWGAYVLSDHSWDEPPRRFIRRAKEMKLSYRIPRLFDFILISGMKDI